LGDDNARMRKHALNRKPYKMLPPELRPRYKTRGDLRMLARSFREGWVHGVPDERVAEWDQDIAEALSQPRTRRIKNAAIKVFLAAQIHQGRQLTSYFRLRRVLFPLQVRLLSSCTDEDGQIRRQEYEAVWGDLLERCLRAADPEEFPFLPPP